MNVPYKRTTVIKTQNASTHEGLLTVPAMKGILVMASLVKVGIFSLVNIFHK